MTILVVKISLGDRIQLILFHQINMTADHMIENHQRCVHLNIILHLSYILMQISSYNLTENEDNR